MCDRQDLEDRLRVELSVKKVDWNKIASELWKTIRTELNKMKQRDGKSRRRQKRVKVRDEGE